MNYSRGNEINFKIVSPNIISFSPRRLFFFSAIHYIYCARRYLISFLLICSYHSVLSPLPFPSIFPHHLISSRHLPFPRIVLLIFPFHPIPSTLLFPPILLLIFPFHPVPTPLPFPPILIFPFYPIPSPSPFLPLRASLFISFILP